MNEDEIHNLRRDADAIIFWIEEELKKDYSLEYKQVLDIMLIKFKEGRMWSGKLFELNNILLPPVYRDLCNKRLNK